MQVSWLCLQAQTLFFGVHFFHSWCRKSYNYIYFFIIRVRKVIQDSWAYQDWGDHLEQRLVTSFYDSMSDYFLPFTSLTLCLFRVCVVTREKRQVLHHMFYTNSCYEKVLYSTSYLTPLFQFLFKKGTRGDPGPAGPKGDKVWYIFLFFLLLLKILIILVRILLHSAVFVGLRQRAPNLLLCLL